MNKAKERAQLYRNAAIRIEEADKFSCNVVFSEFDFNCGESFASEEVCRYSDVFAPSNRLGCWLEPTIINKDGSFIGCCEAIRTAWLEVYLAAESSGICKLAQDAFDLFRPKGKRMGDYWFRCPSTAHPKHQEQRILALLLAAQILRSESGKP